jgi:large subunit ribosomal protein L25
MKRRYDQIDLQALVSGEMIQSVAKVEILNRDDVKEGVLQQELEEISYSAMPEDLIDKVEIDAAGLKLEEKICVGDLEMAKNPKIHLHTDPEAIVVVVARLHKAAEEETSTEEAGETAAEA